MEAPEFVFIDHVAVSVPAGQLEETVRKYLLLGFREVHREEVGGAHQVREVLLRIGDSENLVQLLEPMNESSPVAKALEKNGGRGGLAHLALRVKDIQAAYKYMQEQGFHMTQEPGPGSRGTTIFFVHPKDFSYLIEVVQEGAGRE